MTLVLSLDEKVPTSKLTFTASCGGASASAEVIIDEYDPPNYPNTINLTSDKVFLTQSQNTFTINASIDGRDSNGVVTFDNSQLPSFIETELHDNQLKLSLKNGSDTERGNFTIQVSFLDAATKVIVVETEDYEA
ncbi:hypothetical protein FACS1894166_03750 [Bacilli bacterium]|nr:hypothetical protein FACS1894166_03750 [Bacilli bacterium]